MRAFEYQEPNSTLGITEHQITWLVLIDFHHPSVFHFLKSL